MNWQALEVIRGGKGVWFTVRLIPLSTLLGLGLAGCSQQEAVDPGSDIKVGQGRNSHDRGNFNA